MHQVFAVRLVCEKYLANREDVFLALLNLARMDIIIVRHGTWQMLRLYEVGGKNC